MKILQFDREILWERVGVSEKYINFHPVSVVYTQKKFV